MSDELSQGLYGAITALQKDQTLDSLKEKTLFSTDAASEALKSTELNLSGLGQQSQRLNLAISETLTRLMEEGSKEIGLQCGLLLDLCIYICNGRTDILSIPMQTLNTILLTAVPLEVAVSEVGPLLFENTERRLALTRNNTLVGKNKPGSLLLPIGHQLTRKLYRESPEHDKFATQLRLLIQNSIDIDDKLSLASDWRLSDSDGLYSGLRGTRSWPQEPGLYDDYIKLSEYLSKNQLPAIVDEISRAGSQAELISLLRQVVASLKQLGPTSGSAGLGAASGTSSSSLDWVLDQDGFNTQLHNRKLQRCLHLQIALLCRFFERLSGTGIEPILARVHELTNNRVHLLEHVRPFNNEPARKELEDLAETAFSGARLSLNVKRQLQASEDVWMAMKLQQFGHPDLSSLAQLSDGRKRKRDEHLQATAGSPIEKKKPYFHKMGTPRLTKAWKIETGLDHVREGLTNKEEALDNYKDDLYRANGELETAEGDAKKELEDERDVLQWKIARMERGDTTIEFKEVPAPVGEVPAPVGEVPAAEGEAPTPEPEEKPAEKLEEKEDTPAEAMDE